MIVGTDNHDYNDLCRYGVAVTFVFLITTNLFFLASMVVFNINPLYTWPIYALFLLIDGAYLSANLFKFLTGAPASFSPIFTVSTSTMQTSTEYTGRRLCIIQPSQIIVCIAWH